MFKLTQSENYAEKVGTGEIHNVSTSLEYLAWLAEGNTPEPADPLPVPVITSVTMRQARLALLGAGLLDTVAQAIAAIPDPVQRKAAEIEWEYASTVDRNSAFTQQLAAGLGLSSEQLDSLFTQAAGL